MDEPNLSDQRPNRTARIGVRQQTGKLPTIVESNPESTIPPGTEDVTITQGGVALVRELSEKLDDAVRDFEDKAIYGKEDPKAIRGPWPNAQAVAADTPDEAVRKLALTWEEYSRWRRTKCPPPECRGAIWLDELDQALHELHGEVGELAEVITKNGPFLLAIDNESARLRRHVADEIGDVIFTASWVFDCIDESFLGTRGRIAEGFLPPDHRQALAMTHGEVNGLKLTPAVLNMFDKLPEEVQAYVSFWLANCRDTLLMMAANSQLLSGRFKKLRWHRMRVEGPNPFYDQAERIFNVMLALDGLCVLLGLNLLSCAHGNMAKLDRRFPNGWMAGGGKR